MSTLSIFPVVVFVFLTTSAQALKCNEGFNMTFGGIPLYHWTERTCADNSKCFDQELEISTGVPIPVVMRYGACLSSADATYLDCDALFGPERTFDLADLLNMIPELTKRVDDAVQDFVKDTIGQLKVLLSSGQGTIVFIDGIFTYYEILGYNMTKAVPLKQPLANLLGDLFSGNNELIQQRVTEIFNAIGNLDTANQEFTNAIYNLIKILDVTGQTLTQVKESPVLKPLIERIPGLVRSMLPDSMRPSLWYDVLFKLLNYLDVQNRKRTAEDMVATVKARNAILDYLKSFTDSFFDRFPDLVDLLAKVFDVTGLFDAMMKMVDGYKTVYPDSKFPEIAGIFIKYTKQLLEFNFTSYDPDFATALKDSIIDLQFAIMNLFDYTTDKFTQMLIKAFPAFETYIKIMKAMKLEDVKQLFKDTVTWASTGPYTSEGFVAAIQPTVKKLTASINSFLGDLRKLLQPDSCKYTSCETDLCNAHSYITTSTTSGARERATADVLLSVTCLWITYKAMLG